MSTIAFRSDQELKTQLEYLAKHKGINLSALIKMYLKQVIKRDLNEITENGMTVAEELELLAASSEKFEGKTYDNVEEYLKSLDD